MVIKSAEFITSIANSSRISEFNKPQFAFVGRSNVGKSSLLNALANRNKLAKTSSTPGRTRLINIFEINKQFHFVDLPGYGFALGSKKEQSSWQELIGTYLEYSESLQRVFVLVDIRHEPTEKDKLMLSYLYAYQIPFSIIATKTDKISKNQIQKNLNVIASFLGVGKDDIIYVSSVKKEHLDKVWNIVEQDLERLVDNGS